MKNFTLILVLLGLAATSAYGQEAKGGQTLLQSQTQVVVKEKEEKKAVVTPPKPVTKIFGKRVETGGLLTDVARAEKKRALFDLRTPVDPKKDFDNLIFYPGTDKVQAISLFSFKF